MDEAGTTAFAWGKSKDGEFHRLAHHCADVAACFEVIAALPTMRDRMERSARQIISKTAVSRLAVLVFLHDAGKLHPGFQAKGWPNGAWKGPLRGHVAEGAFLFSWQGIPSFATRLLVEDLNRWGRRSGSPRSRPCPPRAPCVAQRERLVWLGADQAL